MRRRGETGQGSQQISLWGVRLNRGPCGMHVTFIASRSSPFLDGNALLDPAAEPPKSDSVSLENAAEGAPVSTDGFRRDLPVLKATVLSSPPRNHFPTAARVGDSVRGCADDGPERCVNTREEWGLDSQVERGRGGPPCTGREVGIGVDKGGCRRASDAMGRITGAEVQAGRGFGIARRNCGGERENSRDREEGLGVCVGSVVGHAGRWLWRTKKGSVPDETDADSQTAADARTVRRRTAILGGDICSLF